MSAADEKNRTILEHGKNQLIVDNKIFSRLRMFGFSDNLEHTIQKLIDQSIAIFTRSLRDTPIPETLRVTKVLRHPKGWHFVIAQNGTSIETLVGFENHKISVPPEWEFIYEKIKEKGGEKLADVIQKSHPPPAPAPPNHAPPKPTTCITPQKQENEQHEKENVYESDENDTLVMHANGEKIEIDEHAVVRFIQRTPDFTKNGMMPDPIKKLKELFSFAAPEKLNDVHRVRRIISHGFREAEYWRFDTWRFVVEINPHNKKKLLKTVERAYQK